jgi:hypothetical protein
VKAAKLVDAKPKQKCCRSRPRCKRCPVVILALRKADSDGVSGKQLEKVFKRARRK